MSDCRSTLEQLPAYVDDAVGPQPRAAIERHLSLCPGCRREEAAQRGGATVLRRRAAALKGEPAPPGLRTRCQAAIAVERPVSARSWIAVLVPTAVAAVLVVATAVALLKVATDRSSTVLAAELTADHMKCFRFFASGTWQAGRPCRAPGHASRPLRLGCACSPIVGGGGFTIGRGEEVHIRRRSDSSPHVSGAWPERVSVHPGRCDAAGRRHHDVRASSQDLDPGAEHLRARVVGCGWYADRRCRVCSTGSTVTWHQTRQSDRKSAPILLPSGRR